MPCPGHFAPRKETWHPLYRRWAPLLFRWGRKSCPYWNLITRTSSQWQVCVPTAVSAHTTHEYYFCYLSPVISLWLQGSINESGLGLLSWWASS
jgi:hypothetical protein